MGIERNWLPWSNSRTTVPGHMLGTWSALRGRRSDLEEPHVDYCSGTLLVLWRYVSHFRGLVAQAGFSILGVHAEANGVIPAAGVHLSTYDAAHGCCQEAVRLSAQCDRQGGINMQQVWLAVWQCLLGRSPECCYAGCSLGTVLGTVTRAQAMPKHDGWEVRTARWLARRPTGRVSS